MLTCIPAPATQPLAKPIMLERCQQVVATQPSCVAESLQQFPTELPSMPSAKPSILEGTQQVTEGGESPPEVPMAAAASMLAAETACLPSTEQAPAAKSSSPTALDTFEQAWEKLKMLEVREKRKTSPAEVPARCHHPRVAALSQESESWLSKLWCGTVGCDARRLDLMSMLEEVPDGVSICSERMQPPLMERSAASQCDTYVAQLGKPSKPTAAAEETTKGLRCGSCERICARSLDGTMEPDAEPMQEAKKDGKPSYCSVVPVPEQECTLETPAQPDSLDSAWTQRAVFISVGAASGGALAAAVTGVLPLVVGIASLGFSMGLLSSLFGLRAGRWICTEP